MQQCWRVGGVEFKPSHAGADQRESKLHPPRHVKVRRHTYLPNHTHVGLVARAASYLPSPAERYCILHFRLLPSFKHFQWPAQHTQPTSTYTLHTPRIPQIRPPSPPPTTHPCTRHGKSPPLHASPTALSWPTTRERRSVPRGLCPSRAPL